MLGNRWLETFDVMAICDKEYDKFEYGDITFWKPRDATQNDDFPFVTPPLGYKLNVKHYVEARRYIMETACSLADEAARLSEFSSLKTSKERSQVVFFVPLCMDNNHWFPLKVKVSSQQNKIHVALEATNYLGSIKITDSELRQLVPSGYVIDEIKVTQKNEQDDGYSCGYRMLGYFIEEMDKLGFHSQNYQDIVRQEGDSNKWVDAFEGVLPKNEESSKASLVPNIPKVEVHTLSEQQREEFRNWLKYLIGKKNGAKAIEYFDERFAQELSKTNDNDEAFDRTIASLGNPQNKEEFYKAIRYEEASKDSSPLGAQHPKRIKRQQPESMCHQRPAILVSSS